MLILGDKPVFTSDTGVKKYILKMMNLDAEFIKLESCL